ncbi:MAG TPA: RDD family protein [Vicinamibacterales bacterium]|jgi:hypothetical protein
MRRLAAEPLHVLPDFVGRPIASPGRRLVAFAIDTVLLVIPTALAGVVVAGMILYATDRPAYHALTRIKSGGARDPSATRATLRDLAPLLVRLEAPGLPAAAIEATEAGELDKAAALLGEFNYVLSLKLTEGENTKPLPPKTIRIDVERIIPPVARGIALFAVPALYFTLFTCSSRGATPGKRLAGIRVVRLDGERLSWLEGLERFIGYVHIPATLCLSVLDLWRDPNRRLPHDRTVHTAVIAVRSRAATRATQPAAV